MIDWGCGLNHSPISSQVVLLECDLLVSVDAWQKYIDEIANKTYAAKKRVLICNNIKSVAKTFKMKNRQVDLSLCLDIVEHLEMSDALEFLANLDFISKNILIWIPLGDAPVTRDTYGGDNHFYHTHRSTWSMANLEALGYAVEVLEHFHTPIHGHRVDGAWAIKQNRK